MAAETQTDRRRDNCGNRQILPANLLAPEQHAALASRMGEENLLRRLERESVILQKKRQFAECRSPLKHLFNKDVIAARLLKAAGLWERGRAEFRNVRLEEYEVRLPLLGKEFDGFRLVQISDLHIDLDPGIVEPLCELLACTQFDQVVITGDFQDLLLSPQEPVIAATRRLLVHTGDAPLAVPGNHDLATLILRLEKETCLRFLLNEHRILHRGAARLAIVGVDDPHRFRGDDLARALRGVPAECPRVLLAHSPAYYRKAQPAAPCLLLCGHTHGGQICLPGGWPVVRNTRVPPEIFSGAWQRGGIIGYTSRGTGGCGVPVRYFCPPEITLHILRTP